MKKNFKYILILVVAVVLIFLSTLLLNHKYSFLEKIIKDTGLFFNDILAITISDNENKVCDNCNKELENQINELKKVININSTLNEYELVNAVVISHDPGYWYDKVIINKGLSSDIKEGMAVINNSGVIGKVVNVSNFNSTVELLTSENIGKVSIKIEDGNDYIYGLISQYDKVKNLYLVDGISKNIEVGSKITTTGYGDIFPSGILVGEVVSSKNDNYDLAKTLEIKPSVDFNNLNIVSIVKRNVDQ